MWLGDGIVGGDIMDYFFPQKVYLAEALADGDIPLWNNTVALGYPFVADSQIAMWYPTTIPLYSLFSVESAFQINLLIHYALAFLFTWAYGKSIGLRQSGALIAALAFTYGWFPPRLSVEWAVTTGCYMPGTLWCVEQFVRSSRNRWLGVLAVLLALQLFAGHFSLAFITHLIVAVYAFARVTVARRRSDVVKSWRSVIGVMLMQIAAFPMAAAQLSPTWELRQQSQRGGLPIPEVEDGRIPWQHLRQLVMPWIAYGNDMSEYPPPYTNGPAASLFIGVLPFGLAIFGAAQLRRRDRVGRLWRIVIPVAVIFAVGWLTVIYKYLPGFGFFKVPGRYSMIAALGLAVLAGRGWDRIVSRRRAGLLNPLRPRMVFQGLAAVGIGVTIADLYIYSRTVAFTSFVPLTVDELLAESELKKTAEQSGEPLRMLVPGNNALACTGIAAAPGFLGLAPEGYVSETTQIIKSIDPSGPEPGQVDQLRRYGFTHIIFEDAFDAVAWECVPLPPMGDAFLSRVMNRFDPELGGIKPWYIGRLTNTRSRAAMIDEGGATIAAARVDLSNYQPDAIVIKVNTPSDGRLVLTDLAYPGWRLTVDGKPVQEVVVEGLMRGVEVTAGEHTVRWTYEPQSVTTGWVVTVLASLLVAVGLGFKRRQRDSLANR